MTFTSLKKRCFLIFVVVLGMILSVGAGNNLAQAGSFPEREIELIVCYSPGGSTDLMSRIVGGKASEYLKVPVVIINKPGAGGSIAADYVAKSHDGYRIGTVGGSNLGTLMVTGAKVPYTLKDFSAIARAVTVPFLIVTKKGRFDNLKDLIKEAKQKPGALIYGSWGAYGSSHLFGELISQVAGIKMKHVPFKGGAKAMLAAMGGHIDIAITTPSTSGSNIKAGNLTGLAVASDSRIDGFPEVPTLKELGYADAAFEAYDGFATSSKVPKERLEILRSAFERSLKDIGVQKALKKGGMVFGFMNGQDYDDYLAAKFGTLKRVAIEAGMIKK
jgi:tripartite-type tricarboxylate transporter receptor subunit TctC